jgi:peptide deformylase
MTENRPYQIVKYPEPVLLQETAAFDFNAPLIEPDVLVKNMLEAMHAHKGVGLSANQVGLPNEWRIKVKCCCFL